MGLVARLKLVTVTAAGTAQPILTSAEIQSGIVSVTIQASVGTIWVGDSTVKASTTTGIALAATNKDKMSLTQSEDNVIDLAKVYLDASTNGDKASVLYFVRV